MWYWLTRNYAKTTFYVYKFQQIDTPLSTLGGSRGLKNTVEYYSQEVVGGDVGLSFRITKKSFQLFFKVWTSDVLFDLNMNGTNINNETKLVENS